MNTFSLIPLHYAGNMRPFYSRLKHLPGFVLLESSDALRGRYDIVSACPYQRIEFEEHQDTNEFLSRLHELLPQQLLPVDVPFQGGAIGYVSYDFGLRLEDIPSMLKPVFATPLLDFGLYDWAIITDHHLKQVFLFAAHRQAETAHIIDEVLTLWEKNQSPSCEFYLERDFQPLVSKESYKKAFDSIHENIRKGRSYQVNYTQPFTTSFRGDSWVMYDQVCSRNPVPFSAYLKMDKFNILSFSPERYLLMNKGDLLTSPIKGTVKRSDSKNEDEFLKEQLQQCPKNRAENVMIVDLLRNDLGKIAEPGSVHVSSLCEVQSFNGVHHLVSDIRAQCLPSIHAIQAFMSCFPSGSITGAPKHEAMRIINEEEQYARGIYCGSVVYFSAHGRFDSSVAIRTVTEKDKMLSLSTGGGIVIDSDWLSEYFEGFTKISAIIHGL
ncbi:aminodeoxychorismate synthase component I [Legionella israelensis]|uniref:aminodeoxychorismate synthase n=1 Tax=Legionella israelensis TaxID=454 RepID=A0AAX1EGV1_9GAMM|nr:aminodeoxychorismate synthase component I [Legionella israelensis]QBR84087.1 aminodeoxychorismate synthase component I [Legionella israelensis]